MARKIIIRPNTKILLVFLLGLKVLNFTDALLKKEAPFPGPRARINPPIKEAESREALWRGGRDGTVEGIGSDHVPGTQTEQIFDDDVWRGEQGFVSTQVIVPLMITEGYYKRGIPLERIAAACSTNTAKCFGLYPRKGAIEVGSDADLVVVDMEKKMVVEEKDPNWSDSSNYSIYQGRELQGWPILTMVRGRVVMKDRQLVGGPSGKYIPQRVGVHK